MVTETRYDYGIERLDMESTLALVRLAAIWQRRNHIETCRRIEAESLCAKDPTPTDVH